MNDTRIDKALEALDKREAEIIANASAPPVMRQVLPEQPAILDEGFTTHLPGGEPTVEHQWSATMSLRFVPRAALAEPYPGQTNFHRSILQQKWVNQFGQTIWVDVPMVTE